ncbi:MAG: hydantoinase/oxoprolinase family protein [Blastocatellia bacterium]|nr:hydantoinase/oxoprolinase family protein [Blastocatellia bacterium]
MDPESSVRIGIDTGGTFTDVIVWSGGSLETFKLPSTPDDPSQAILDGIGLALDRVGRGGTAEVVHGTTVGTNALLERKGARTALVSTLGFEDVLAIRRQARPELYNLGVRAAPPLAPPELWFGLDERIDADGSVFRAPSDSDIDELARMLRAFGAESVAVCLLFSFANPVHEKTVEARLQRLGIPVSVSHRILPEYREYERATTVTVNAYLSPRMRVYLERLDRGVAGTGVKRLRVMQSSGGAISAATAAKEPVRTILSGPAGGIVAAERLAKAASLGDLVTFDMGGTSTDVALIAGGRARSTNEAVVAGVPVAVPILDIHTVGSGGGSIARVDDGGALRVGPESAGANPGPACYGSGDRPTVTDANVVLGRIRRLLGGAFEIDVERAWDAIDRLAVDMSRAAGEPVTRERAALDVLRVAEANMERALRVVSVERGYDPRGASLLSFGGAGGLHACALAESLRIRRVIVPIHPGAFSALGLLLGDVVRDVSRTVLGRDHDPSSVLDELEIEARELIAAEGIADARVRVERSAAMRYRGQSFEIDIAWSAAAVEHFHAEHQARYGHADRDRPVDVVHLRVRAAGESTPLDLGLASAAAIPGGALPETTTACFADGWRDVPLHERSALAPGRTVSGPAIIEEYGATLVLPNGWTLGVDAIGNLVCDQRETGGTA